jgi:hypothetical protein
LSPSAWGKVTQGMLLIFTSGDRFREAYRFFWRVPFQSLRYAPNRSHTAHQ